MATIDQIVTRIGRRLRRGVTSGSNLQSEIIDELVNAQNALEEGATLPWFLFKFEAKALAANASSLQFATDLTGTFIRLWDDKPFTYIDPTGVALEEIDIPLDSEVLLLLQRHPGIGSLPKEGVAAANGIEVRPVPTQAITYNIRYYQKDPTVPAEGVSTLWSTNFSNLLMNTAGMEIAWTLRDDAAFARFERDLAKSTTDFIRAVAARENAGQVHIMGDP